MDAAAELDEVGQQPFRVREELADPFVLTRRD